MKKMLIAFVCIAVLFICAISFAGDCGDVNNSGTINALDITYLINYLYKHGQAPNCGPETGTVTDIDGNIYHTIKIDNQWWTLENLKVTHYRNGDPIPYVADSATWAGLSTGAYCVYNSDANNVATYGRMYNWYSVNDGRNMAPAGWHVATDAEWQTLIDYLGGNGVAGGKMKEAGIIHWLDPNTGATNESGFTAMPGGYRYLQNFSGLYFSADFWSSTENSSSIAFGRHSYHYNSGVNRDYNDKRHGFSDRCVKD